MFQQHLVQETMEKLPSEIAQMFVAEPSWLSLSSPLRQSIEKNPSIVFRQPNISSWIQMEEL